MNTDIEIVECGSGSEVNKRLVVILLGRGQLVYDVENICYIEGDILPEDMQHQRHMVQDVGQDGNVDRVTRVLDLAHAKVVELLYPFTQHAIRHPAVDDRLREKPVYGIFLNVPETISQTTLNLLGKLIHEYMVCKAVADWLSITNTAKSDVWKAKSEDAVGEIRQNLCARMTRIRRRMHPF